MRAIQAKSSPAKASAPTWFDFREASGTRRLVQLALSSLVAAAIILFFYCPKFVLWRGIYLPHLTGIGVPPAAQTAEVRRAHSSLAQLDDPFAAVTDPIGRPIAWRLLFPFVWHFLNLPRAMYLLMPLVGCLLTLGLIAALIVRRTGDWRWAFLTAIVLGASPWFFVSTGWLAYFDSWMIAGLLAASFFRSRVLFAACCLLVPWIDERFLLGLPLCLLIRSFDDGPSDRRPAKDWAIDAAIAVGSTAAYVGLRLLWAQRGTGETSVYVAEHLNWSRLAGYSPWRCVEGIWIAIRAGWFFAVIFFWLLWRAGRRFLVGMLTLALVAILTVGLVVASDIHRTLCVMVPLPLAGILLCARHQAGLLRFALPWAAAATLLLPAAHVFTTEREPILYFYAEWERWAHPPPDVDPQTYVGLGVTYAEQQKPVEAEACFEAALALDPTYCPAHVQRATLHLNAGDSRKAARVLEEAIRQCPDSPDVHFLLGIFRLRANDQAGGAAELKAALTLSRDGWPRRQETLEILGQVSASGAK
ncbi:MAG TPA: tetratricopeptide repeat protein [Pirellulales bacterium]|nr:tetratricopeptide repeat protein [Pirellulales bacterium]